MTNEQELRAIDLWICENITHPEFIGFACNTHGYIDRERIGTGDKCPWCGSGLEDYLPRYTTSPADSQALLKRCAEKLNPYEVSIGHHCYDATGKLKWMVCGSNSRSFQTIEGSLELAIAQFAKKLFSGGKD